jgi:hypothetical protein
VRSDESGPSLALDAAIVFFTTTTAHILALADSAIQASSINSFLHDATTILALADSVIQASRI